MKDLKLTSKLITPTLLQLISQKPDYLGSVHQTSFMLLYHLIFETYIILLVDTIQIPS